MFHSGLSFRKSVTATAVFTLLTSVACTSGNTPPQTPEHEQAGKPPVRDYPGTLRPPKELGADFQWRQQVIARWPEGTRSFDAVLSKTGDELLLVGLGPMDTPGFVLTLDAQAQLKFENHTGQAVHFNPRYVVLDVQRVFYPWFPAASSSGIRETVADNERVTETWKNGTLYQRTFERLDNNPPGQIVISYTGWTQGSRAPKSATLSNRWFGYSLTIETIEQSSL